ncbi:MAG TPA: glycosyltransferase [Solirubrobacterales bacterium]|nr:glycosyltransferase [Solirubrobacterales bacterium]
MEPLESLTIGYFGHYDPEYSRNRTLIKALRRAGASVIAINDRHRFLSRTPRLAWSATRARPDLLLVGFPAHSDVATAKILSVARRRPVIFSPLTSLWETVLDRRGLSTGSLSGWRSRLTDRISCSLADSIWLDTRSHIEWFSEQYGIPASRFRRVWLGADDDVMKPRPRRPSGTITVFFYGTFIPLHGIEHIVDAAAIVAREDERIRFVLCGHGQTYPEIRSRANRLGLRNLEFIPRRSPRELAMSITESDVCLGIFGRQEKAQRAIPNKVFDALACERPVITGDTPAARECLTHGEHAWLCPPGDPDALAAVVLEVGQDPGARARVAHAGHELFKREFSLDALTRALPPLVLETLGDRR